MRRFSTVALAIALGLGCSEDRTIEITRLPLACADDVRARVTQVVVGAEGDFTPVLVSQPPDVPLSLPQLPQSARVLTVTGTIGGQPALIGRTAEIDLATADAKLAVAYGPPGGFCQTGSMRVARTNHAAVRMRDGRVLVAGGGDPSIEIYDPRTATWGSYDSARYELGGSAVTAVALVDGRVLLIGDGTAQLVDEQGTPVKPALFLGGLRDAAAVVLSDKRVLVVGTQASAIYDPVLGAFTGGPGTIPRAAGAAAFLLADGRVLIVGGGAPAQVVDPRGSGPSFSNGDAVAWAQLSTGTIVGFGGSGRDVAIRGEDMLADLLSSGTPGTRATVLADDQVLVTGDRAALFVPSRGSSTMQTATLNPGASATLLEDGTVLLAGGGVREASLYFHSTVNAYSSLPVMTFNADELLIPRLPLFDNAHRDPGSYTLKDTYALLGGARFAGVTLTLSFERGNLEVIVGWRSPLDFFTVRVAPGAKIVLLHGATMVCTGGDAPASGFITVDARDGRIRATVGGTRLLDCAAALPSRFAVGVGSDAGGVTVDNLEATR